MTNSYLFRSLQFLCNPNLAWSAYLNDRSKTLNLSRLMLYRNLNRRGMIADNVLPILVGINYASLLCGCLIIKAFVWSEIVIMSQPALSKIGGCL